MLFITVSMLLAAASDGSCHFCGEAEPASPLHGCCMSGGGSCPFRAYSTNAKIIPSLTNTLDFTTKFGRNLVLLHGGLKYIYIYPELFLVFSILSFALITALYRFFVPLIKIEVTSSTPLSHQTNPKR